MNQPIKRALISVSDKTGLVELASLLTKFNVEIISTGGTAKALAMLGFKTTDISEVTNFPEIMDGRVKTLHPLVHGALLGCLDNEAHLEAMAKHHIQKIDLVVVNLYPFAVTVARDASFEEIIENIDIGGPSMIRSAAKNYKFTTIITNPMDYPNLAHEMEQNNGAVSDQFNFSCAANAFMVTANYDTVISNWFTPDTQQFPGNMVINLKRNNILRYGENPHQNAAIYTLAGTTQGIATASQLQGKELSYNNIHDADSALNLVSEFSNPAVVIIKHANPCGVAESDNIAAAYKNALASDPLSAFGGVIALNREVDMKTAIEITKLFAEVVIAPSFADDAREVFASKKNLRLLVTEIGANNEKDLMLKSIRGGVLLQENDFKTIATEDLKIVTKLAPTPQQMKDLLFAARVCKHVKSNAIVIAQAGATLGVGAGQMSRVDSVKIAIERANKLAKVNPELNNFVLASDAFFPFADGVMIAAEGGVKAIIQPGGSIQDQEVIAIADKLGVAMVFSGIRNFKH